MKWTESATKHWSTRTAVSNTEILSPPNKYTFWTASIWHGTWHIHIWKVLQSRSYCIGCISPLSRYIVWRHCTADQHACSPQSDGCTLHNCTRWTHWTECSLPSAEYSWVHTMLNCTMLNVTRLVHVTMLDVTEQFWPKIWSHFRPYCLSLHSLTVSFSSESRMIFSQFFQNFVGLLQDFFSFYICFNVDSNY